MQPKPAVAGHLIASRADRIPAIVWRPPEDDPVRFAVVHVPAAFEEMNKSRRTVAMQARAFAAAGGVVAVFDPAGTGDSPVGHGEATWERWREDAVAVWEWLARETSAPVVLWGLRLGGLLAAELAASGAVSPSLLLLWQPVASGRTYFNQFLRLASAREFMGGADAGTDVRALRTMLAAGEVVEVAGYRVHPALVAGAEAVALDALPAPRCAVVWRESALDADPQPSPVASRIADRWTAAGTPVDVAAVSGPSFWAALEIEEAPLLVEATMRAVTRTMLVAAGTQ